jgi:2-amino-4-hydroxy-6-hydroxymethyldihydropteridine diphosphokinase
MIVYLGLGSNLGDRESHLRSAIRTLRPRGLTFKRCASLYWTEPRDIPDQPWFLNTVVEAGTDLDPVALLQECLRAEQNAGRVRHLSKGPRTLDIDILLCGSQVIQTPELVVPHPRLSERRFVLVPLVELEPELQDPLTKTSVKSLLESCADPGVVRLYGPPLL